MQHSRAEAGCVIYTFTEDPIEHDVVVLTEQWIDRPSLDAHLAGLATAPQPATMPGSTGRDIAVFEADDGAKL